MRHLKAKDADQDESTTTSNAAHEDSETTIHKKYNLRKRKHMDEHEEKLKNKKTKSTSKQPRLSQTQRSRENDKHSTQLVKSAEHKRFKTSGKNTKQPHSTASKKTSVIPASKRKRVQTRSVLQPNKLSELQEKVHKKRPSTREAPNNRKKATLNTRKNTKILSEPISQLKSKARKPPNATVEKLRNVRQSGSKRKTSPLSPKRSPKKDIELDSSKKTEPTNCETLNTSAGKMLLKNNNFVAKQSIEIIAGINVGIQSQIYGICVTKDNLIWVNYLLNHVKLFDASGKVLRSVDLEQSPVFNCCTPDGNLLFTQGYADGARPEITVVTQEGNHRNLVDLSSYATNLCGIICEDGKIYVIGHNNKIYFVIKLDMNGEVKGTYKTKPGNVNINKIISQKGKLFAISTLGVLLPLENDRISTKATNKVNINPTSAVSGASVDNFGNVVFGYLSDIGFLDPCLQHLQKIHTEIPGCILSTAVDHQHQLWIGTTSGEIYIANYMN